MITRPMLVLSSCVALASCSETAAGPRIGEAEATPTVDVAVIGNSGTSDVAAHVVPLSATARATRAATGAIASGHADVVVEVSSALTIASKYSFVAISTRPSASAPFAAKGELQGTIIRTTGTTTVTEQVHADIDCMNFISVFGFGDIVAISGRLKKLTRDGEPVPVTAGMQVVFSVRDNGEGGDSPPDLASFIAPIIEARPLCQIFFVILEPNQRGNIQVRQSAN
jgi:hypothetical protein